MAKKKSYEWRDSSYNSRGDSDGLRQRRLKEESRWKFNPNQDYNSENDDNEDEDFFDEEEYER